MKEGKEFEQQFKDSVPENTYFLRLKDVFSGTNNANRTFTPKNPCDSIMYKKPIMYMLEMKSTKGTSFSFSEKIIKANQIKELSKADGFDGIIAGFVFNFRKYNLTFFIHIDDFIKFKETCGKKSINKNDCEKIGILIKQTLKVSRYHYHIGEFIKELSEKLA